MPKLKPSLISLEVEHAFKASHSLEGFELPHFHLWKLAVEFQASLPLANDRLIDLVFLQNILDQITSPLKGTHLNETFKSSPTSENMALWLWQEIVTKLPEAPLYQVKVNLCDLEGVSTGSARVSK
jgi:6-pyruvoyl-tetrahydropterin synthase